MTRFSALPLAPLFAVLLSVAAPASAQMKPDITRAESKECMFATAPFILVAMRTDPKMAEQFKDTARFWAKTSAALGPNSKSDSEYSWSRLNQVSDEFDVLGSEADFPAFLAKYQPTFDACEEKRKALQAG